MAATHNGISRRSFLASAGALAMGGGAMSAALGDDGRELARIGIISDTHVTGPESAERLAEALAFFAGRRVDAVMHCGDVTDLGYLARGLHGGGGWQLLPRAAYCVRRKATIS